MHGVRIPRKVVRNQERRHAWLSELDNPVARFGVWVGCQCSLKLLRNR
jgi:hypothetical protein